MIRPAERCMGCGGGEGDLNLVTAACAAGGLGAAMIEVEAE